MCVCACVQCDVLIEQYEEVIEDWYKGSQEEDLTTYLCEKHVLKGQDAGNLGIQKDIPVSVITCTKYTELSELDFFLINNNCLLIPHLPFQCLPTMPLACLGENWDHRKKKGDPAAIAEDKKKKKKKKGAKKGKTKTEDAEEGEKAAKKKNEKKVKKKKKSKVPVPKTAGGSTSEDEVQPQVPLPGHKTEL